MRTAVLSILAAVGCLSACSGVVSTRVLANAFNGGALDGTPDPFYGPSQRATDTLAWRMRDELGQGYFDQGSEKARVVRWLRYLGQHATEFMTAAVSAPVAPDAGAPEASTRPADAGPGTKELPPARQRVQTALSSARTDQPDYPSPGTEPFCDPGGHPNPGAIEGFADYVRFNDALQRATANAVSLVAERFATMDEAVAGSKRAFEQTATYLARRAWRRDRSHHVTGLVVKGGAATGIFSAGVVYVALNMLNECVNANLCAPGQSGFAMASGTSTGATVVTAVDAFQTALALDSAARTKAIAAYRNWYLCSAMNDLYCVRNRVMFDLARSHAGSGMDVLDSFLDFTGLAHKAEQAYGCNEMTNRMELILNTVDFRTGRLYALSDQDPATLRAPWDVAKAVVSSAALPFIVRPTYKLPVDPVDAGNFAYLDGGIRSELPLLALVRRGVERMLVVSSGASVTADDAPIGNALSMAIRYIDISTGGVTESELDHARASAQASRLAEYESCQLELDQARRAGHPRCEPPCNPDRLCAGDFEKACSPTPQTLSNDGIVATTFQTTGVWRNEDRVPGLPGYSFNPDGQRRLMLAGMEAARQQCAQLAAALDIPVVDPQTLAAWCTPRLPSTLEQCGQARLDQLKASPDAPDCPDDLGPTPSPDAGSTSDCAGRSP
ncbi:MAG: patatin-like phospholipase family protein [Polyangiaceae bacterium]